MCWFFQPVTVILRGQLACSVMTKATVHVAPTSRGSAVTAVWRTSTTSLLAVWVSRITVTCAGVALQLLIQGYCRITFAMRCVSYEIQWKEMIEKIVYSTKHVTFVDCNIFNLLWEYLIWILKFLHNGKCLNIYFINKIEFFICLF